MNGDAELYLQRAENELIAAQMLFEISYLFSSLAQIGD